MQNNLHEKQNQKSFPCLTGCLPVPVWTLLEALRPSSISCLFQD